MRRIYEREVLDHYYACLLENGVSGRAYTFEQCWRDYRFQLWRPLISLLALAPSFARQHRSKTGMFSPTPTAAERALLQMYEQVESPPVESRATLVTSRPARRAGFQPEAGGGADRPRVGDSTEKEGIHRC